QKQWIPPRRIPGLGKADLTSMEVRRLRRFAPVPVPAGAHPWSRWSLRWSLRCSQVLLSAASRRWLGDQHSRPLTGTETRAAVVGGGGPAGRAGLAARAVAALGRCALVRRPDRGPVGEPGVAGAALGG